MRMKTRNIYIVLSSVFLVVIVLCAANVIVIKKGQIEININYSKTHDHLVNFLIIELVMEKHIPENISNHKFKKTTLIYVLGGNQNSLIHRFRKASSLYHQDLSDKILILSRPGITEFNSELGRNMTNDEWSRRELERLDVRKEDIQPVSVQNGIFGTLNEEKSLSDIVRKKKYKRLILVTSDYHTRRVYYTFSRDTSNNSLEIYLYGSNDTRSLRVLLYEYIKLFLYDNFIIQKR